MEEQDPTVKKERQKGKKPPVLMSAAGLGTQMAVAFGLFVWGGRELDKEFDKQPLFLLLGIGLALLYSAYEVWKLTKKI